MINNSPNIPKSNQEFIANSTEDKQELASDRSEQKEIQFDPTQADKKQKDGAASQTNIPSVDTSAVQAVVQGQQATGQSNSPLIADDVDVIEKEWVDRAKAVIKAYENDPHQQEREINKLQQTYLEKRYNKKISKVDT